MLGRAHVTDYSKYKSIVFIDTMVVLHGQPLDKQPWKEIDPFGPILVLIVPQVQTEIDKRKLDGRLSARARAFSRLIRPSVSKGGEPIQIVSGPPVVDIGMAFPKQIPWEKLDLDKGEGDDVIVAQILHLSDLPPSLAVLISHDGNPLAKASRHGIKVAPLSDKWLLSPEPSPAEKENTRLRAVVEEFQKTEPGLEVEVSIEAVSTVKAYKVEPLSKDEQKALHQRLVQENPRNDVSPSHLHWARAGSTYDYNKYCDRTLFRHATNFHDRVETMFNQHEFCVQIKNAGSIPAENLIVEITSSGASIRRHFTIYKLQGPSAPKARSPFDLQMPHFPGFPTPIGRHEMVFAKDADGGQRVEVHCQDFRQGRTWRFAGIVAIDSTTDKLDITTRVTAANLRGEIKESASVDVQLEAVRVEELVDILAFKFRVDFPMRQRCREELGAENWKWFREVY